MGSGFARGVGPLPYPFLTAFHGPCPPEKGPLGSPARLALRGRRCYAHGGPTRTARFAQQRLLSPWGSCFVTARGRYHLFPGDGRSGAGLGERPGFCVAFLALVETPAEGGRRLDAKRPERAGPGAKDPGPRSFVWQAVGPSAPRPPNAAAPRTAPPAGRRGRRRFYGRGRWPRP